jgi:hypothetical protein
MARETKRDDLSPTQQRKLAERASFYCSRPDCRKLTIGPPAPGGDPEGSTNIGVAAHICAAAPNGPRYDPKQTPQERSSIKNGIWLCEDDARRIDNKADERAYSAELLHKWKSEHEGWVRTHFGRVPQPISEVSGTHSAKGKGCVTALDVRGAAIIHPGTRSHAEGEGNVTGTRIGG